MENSAPAFPSGHVFGSTVFFGFIGFLAVYYRMKGKFLVPLLVLVAAFILLVGPARIYEQAHWPSDVVAGYLLGALWLLVVIPLFIYARSTKWMSSRQRNEDLSAVSGESYRTERSIASVVVLDPERGTATKVYKPPAVVRLLYWLAFQAKFPYEGNPEALQASAYRRKIASLLTVHRFGKDLVAPVTAVDCISGNYSLVTEYVPGKKVKNDEPTKRFLGQVAETFAEAGLSVWQINPRNPHAHTNLILTPEGDLKIIDLESAVVTVLPAPGQFRSALKSGNFPIFDDIAFPRLRHYITANQAAIETSLGPDGLAELKLATDQAEQTISSWKDSEPRIWGRLVSRTYKLLNWKAFFQNRIGGLAGADRAAEVFLSGGIDRWEKEGRLEPSKASALRDQISSGEARDAVHHLGAHLVLTVGFGIPLPGIRSLARFAWTAAFWFKARARGSRRSDSESAQRVSNIHTPLVMVVSLVPVLGAFAYLAAPPLRQKVLIRLMFDQIGRKLPFRVYERMRLSQWLVPAPKNVDIYGFRKVAAETPMPR